MARIKEYSSLDYSRLGILSWEPEKKKERPKDCKIALVREKNRKWKFRHVPSEEFIKFNNVYTITKPPVLNKCKNWCGDEKKRRMWKDEFENRMAVLAARLINYYYGLCKLRRMKKGENPAS